MNRNRHSNHKYDDDVYVETEGRKVQLDDEDYKKQVSELKFREWVQRKDLFEKGLLRLGQLDETRCDDEDKWSGVATALAAIDRGLGIDVNGRKLDEDDDDDDDILNEHRSKLKKKSTLLGPPQSMRDAFRKWCITNKTFNWVKLPKSKVKLFSDGYVETAFIDDEEVEGDKVILSVKYIMPAKQQKGKRYIPLSNDQLLSNKLFLSLIKRQWHDAHDNVREKLAEELLNAQERVQARLEEKYSDEDPRERRHLIEEELDSQKERLELKALSKIGIRQLSQWVEEDEDAEVERKKEAKLEREAENKAAHDAFVRVKNARRIRLPPPKNDGKRRISHKPPRMDFSGGKGLVRSKKNFFKATTVDLMRDSGFKYVHAFDAEKQGRAGDYERSLAQLEREKEARKAESKSNRTEKAEKKWKKWVEQKKYREKAINHIKHIETTTNDNSNNNNNLIRTKNKNEMTSSLLRFNNNLTNTIRHKKRRDGPGPEIKVIKVGIALKLIDRTLFREWVKWQNGIIPRAACLVLWDYFSPHGCDIHGSLQSNIKSIFLKLLRPGLDYKEAFRRACVRKWAKVRDEQNLPESDRKKYEEELALNRREMTRFLKELGLKLQPDQIRHLIDAFDTNGDGDVSMSEFIAFTGERASDMGGEVTDKLNQLCLWETTDKLTGTQNGFSISSSKGDDSDDDSDDDNYSDDSDEDEYSDDFDDTRNNTNNNKKDKNIFKGTIYDPKGKLHTLKSGEKRRKIALPILRKRIKLLQQYGLINKKLKRTPNGFIQKFRGDLDENDDDDDTNDIDYSFRVAEEDEYDDDDKPRCEVLKMKKKNLKDGLKILSKLSKQGREIEAVRTMLENGKPPKQPKLWLEVDDSMEYDPEILTKELVLRWESVRGDQIAFYSLEMGGEVDKRGNNKQEWREIFRDPPDPNDTPMYWHEVEDLKPATSYAFRLRAFNGFGPSSYCQAIFTTRPAPPLMPVVVSNGPTSIHLRWKFSKTYMKRISELRQLFNEADIDGNGVVSRSELLNMIQDENPKLLDFLRVGSTYNIKDNNKDNIINQLENHDEDDDDEDHGRTHKKYRGALSLFDDMNDDDDIITWEEFERYFHGIGAFDHEEEDNRNIDTLNSIVGNNKTMKSTYARSVTSTFSRNSLRSTRNRTNKNSKDDLNRKRKKQDKLEECTYIVELCLNEREDIWKQVWKGNKGHAKISRLDPGESLRFRVCAINKDGLASGPSQSVVTNTLLPTPLEPNIYPRGNSITAVSLRLYWESFDSAMNHNSRKKREVDQVLSEWTNAQQLDDHGVNVAAMFKKYDTDNSGSIDNEELIRLLEDLGIKPTEERIREAWEELDSNGDGIIDESEFITWINKREITYVIKRSDGIHALELPYNWKPGLLTETDKKSKNRTTTLKNSSSIPRGSTKSVSGFSTMTGKSSIYNGLEDIGPISYSTSSYRGQSTKCEISGLYPNTLYHFRLRYVNSKSNSLLSAPLEIMTPPLMPDSPIIIRTTKKSVVLKWYPKPGGAQKYILQIRFIECLDVGFHGAENINQRALQPEGEWETIYEGSKNTYEITGLRSESVYRVRVCAINRMGLESEWSEMSQINTFLNDNQMQPSSQNAQSAFTIECSYDIVEGDTILFMERLYTTPIGTITTKAKSADIKANYIGDRSIAARVLQIHDTSKRGSYYGQRSNNNIIPSSGSSVISASMASTALGTKSRREMKLKVLWTTFSNDENQHLNEIRRGDIIKRAEKYIFQFEAFRMEWFQEQLRRSAEEEKILEEEIPNDDWKDEGYES